MYSKWFVHSDLSKQEKQDFTHQHMVGINSFSLSIYRLWYKDVRKYESWYTF